MTRYAQRTYYLLCFMVAVVVYVDVATLASRGQWFASSLLVFGLWAIFLLLACIEGGFGHLKDVIDPRKQSWAFLCDPLLAVGFGVAAYAWQSPRRTAQLEWMNGGWWLLTSMIAGVAATYVFTLMDRPRYDKAHHESALKSPTKVWHDWPTYTAMFSSAIAIMVPLLWVWTWHTWTVLGIVLVWAAAGVRDVIWPPNVRIQHIAWDATRFAPVS